MKCLLLCSFFQFKNLLGWFSETVLSFHFLHIFSDLRQAYGFDFSSLLQRSDTFDTSTEAYGSLYISFIFSLECLPFFFALIFLVLYFKAILSFAMASFLCILAHIYEVV